MLDQRVIEKCADVLRQTEDGNRLTARELSEVEFLCNNYHRLGKAQTARALVTLDNMIEARMSAHP